MSKKDAKLERARAAFESAKMPRKEEHWRSLFYFKIQIIGNIYKSFCGFPCNRIKLSDHIKLYTCDSESPVALHVCQKLLYDSYEPIRHVPVCLVPNDDEKLSNKHTRDNIVACTVYRLRFFRFLFDFCVYD